MLKALFVGAILAVLALPSFAVTRTWTGATSANWSDPTNWSPVGVPVEADTLLLGTSNSKHSAMNNDLPSWTRLGPISMPDLTSFSIGGNPLVLTGAVTGDCWVLWNVDLRMEADVTLPVYAINGTIDVNGRWVTLNAIRSPAPSADINGLIVGAGKLTLIGFNPRIIQTSPFSGTVDVETSCELVGSMPDASFVVNGQLSGDGTIGDLSGTGDISPGNPASIYNTLHAKSLSLDGAYIVNVAPFTTSVSDRLEVTGAVRLSGSLYPVVGVPGTPPPPGREVVIIENDGTGPVIGTFHDLPEGALIAADGFTMRISYHGGDGNDVTLTNVAYGKTWIANCGNKWSDACNWLPAIAPVSGETLDFGAIAVGGLDPTNDLPSGFAVGGLTLNGYEIDGNPITLMGDISTGPLGGDVKMPVKIGAAVHLRCPYFGTVDVNGQSVVIDGWTQISELNGSGTIAPAILQVGGGTFAGTLSGSLELGALPHTSIAGVTHLSTSLFDAQLADIAIDAGGTIDPGTIYVGTITATSLSLAGTYDCDLYGNTVDTIIVTGPISLSGPLNFVVRQSGQTANSYTIIDNRGSAAVSGTFSGLPEGAAIQAGGSTFTISYHGGDGNDVVLIRGTVPTVALTQSSAGTLFGEPLTVTATMSAPSGTPTGSVTFTADGLPIGTVSVQNGVATMAVTALNSGMHAFVATFLGTGAFANSVSASIAHLVTHGQTKTNIGVNQTGALFGQTVRFTVTVSVQAPASGQPTGSVTVLGDGVPLGTAPVVNGTATFDTAALHAGMRSITATYGGDANFDGSTASAIQQNVGKAQTAVDARPRTPLFIGEMPFITVFVNVTPGSSLVPTGAVSISEGGANLGTQALSGGVATFSLTPFAVGNHTLVVNYGGDPDFEASSETIIQSVVVPAISIQGARTIQGNRGVTSVSLMVSLSAPISQTARVSFSTVAGSATEGEDYESASGVIEFAPGELTKAIELHIIGDTFPEGDETFSVLLSDPVNATIDTPSAVVVIVNNNPVPPRRRASRH
jgi:hypothetical protein